MKNLNFIAVDCETAFHEGNDCELCSIGFAFVENGKLVDTKYFLIRPIKDLFSKDCQKVHQITREDVRNEPYFVEIWPTIKPYFENTVIVAHNAKSAELTYLSKILLKYNFEIPSFKYIDTFRVFNASLKDVCTELNINMKCHHNALDDAINCAKCILEHPDINLKYKVIHQLINDCGGQFNNTYVDKYRLNRVSLANIIGDIEKIPKNNFCTNKIIYLSGNFENKYEIYRFILYWGGKIANNVTKKTSLVIVGERDLRYIGSKSTSLKKAEKYNIQCILKDKFYQDLKNLIIE